MAKSTEKPSPKTRFSVGVIRLIRVAAALLSVAIIGIAAVGIWFMVEVDRPVHSGSKPIDLIVPYGTSARGIVGMIQGAGLEVNERLFLGYAVLRGVQTELMAGVYEIEPAISTRGLVERLSRRDENQTEFRILEGWTVQQILEALSRQAELRFDLQPAIDKPAVLAKVLGMEAGHPEGWLYPDVFVVKKGTAASDLLKRSAAIQSAMLSREWDKRAQGLPYRSLYEALIVASIVEKETQYPGDREKVAAVFTNRLHAGMPLQADPTVIYGLGKDFNGDITKKHLKQDTPYNTYTRKTLPPTPISNPGPRAVRAALNPADSRALYFVARGDGSSEFSDSLREHNLAVDRYIKKIASQGAGR